MQMTGVVMQRPWGWKARLCSVVRVGERVREGGGEDREVMGRACGALQAVRTARACAWRRCLSRGSI